jgi:hypothetical protein
VAADGSTLGIYGELQAQSSRLDWNVPKRDIRILMTGFVLPIGDAGLVITNLPLYRYSNVDKR